MGGGGNSPLTDYEIIFIDDGSKDGTNKIVEELCSRDKNVRGVFFSRNFGKEAAMLAGLERASGDYVAVMDVDMQDPPELLSVMVLLLLNSDLANGEEYDCIGARRVTRAGEPKLRSFFARHFYKIINKISDIKLVDGARDFRLMRRQMVDALLRLKEKNRFSKGLFAWVGFNTKYLEYENRERRAGESKWSFWNLIKYSIDGIVSFSTAPLFIISVIGFVICAISIVFALYFIIDRLLYNNQPQGYAAMMVLMLFLGGAQILSIGVLGQYLAKVFSEVKARPSYIIRDEIGFNKKCDKEMDA